MFDMSPPMADAILPITITLFTIWAQDKQSWAAPSSSDLETMKVVLKCRSIIVDLRLAEKGGFVTSVFREIFINH